MKTWRGELLSAGCGLALIVLMFGFAWFEIDGIPGGVGARSVVSTENGWDGLTDVRWLMLATALAALAAPALRAARPELHIKLPTTPMVLALGSLTSLVLMLRVLIDLPSPPSVPDQKLGAVLGLASALGIALGGWESLLAGRERAAVRARAR